MTRILVAMTSFNRKERTLAALHRLHAQDLPVDVDLDVVLVDDNSPDGTADAVRQEHPDVEVRSGTGELYWGGGMRRALAASDGGGHDWYLWLNDDTLLHPGAVASMLDTHQAVVRQTSGRCIVVGATCDPDTGAPTYGGVAFRRNRNGMQFVPLPPRGVPQRCDTLNGNVVLVPAAVRGVLGDIDRAFTHSMGDFDYGLRAAKARVEVWSTAHFVGTCARNSLAGTWQDDKVEFVRRIRLAAGPKGVPPREWLTFVRRHAGPTWPLRWVMPYLHIARTSLRRNLRLR